MRRLYARHNRLSNRNLGEIFSAPKCPVFANKYPVNHLGCRTGEFSRQSPPDPDNSAAKPVRLVFSNYDSPRNPFYGGGGSAAIHEVARRLAREHTVEVVIGRYPGCHRSELDGVRYHPVGLARAGPKLGQLLFQFSLPLCLRQKPFDVWCESLTPPFSTACLQRFARQPVVALTQILGGQAMRRKYRLPFDRVERAGLRTYRWAIATSQYLSAQLHAANPRLRVTVIPNGVSSDLVRLDSSPGGRHILFLGRIDVEQKGLDLLLEALASVAAALPLPVVLAGGGDPAQEAFVARRIRELDLAEKVRMTGRVQGSAKDQLLRDAAFLVMPSRFEASPLVMLEAFCYRLPVVLYGIPELVEVPDTCCLKVPPFDVPALGQALLALARDPARRDAMGRAAKAHARAFDWDDLARRYADFFETARQEGVSSAPRG